DHGVRNIPQPLAKDDGAHVGLYTWLPGKVPETASPDCIEAALAFLLAVNAAPRNPAALDPGAEACFSLDEHIATIDRRVARLSLIDAEAPHFTAAESLIAGRLNPVWQRVKTRLLESAQQLDIPLDARLDDASLCV